MKKNLHQTSVEPISIPEVWKNSDIILIDTRSESEFAQGAIPDAINIPLLSDSERAIVGTLYKQSGQSTAVEKGYEIFEPKTQAYLEAFKQLPDNKQVVVYCARGGMRSQVVAAFLTLYARPVKQLTGGYKTFRQWNLEQLDTFKLTYPVVLHGKTGVGKTLVLEQLDNALDLEGLANHRGSMFGGIGKTPVGQKNFEATLLYRLEELDNSRPVFIEGESRRIGKTTIPGNIFEQMRAAKMMLLEATIETRVKRTVHEYIDLYPDTIPVIRRTIQDLQPDLGKKNIETLLESFDKGDYAWCFKFILLNYYDKKYTHAFKGMDFGKTISTEDIKEAACLIERFANTALKSETPYRKGLAL